MRYPTGEKGEGTMILITGGAGSGKRGFARTLGYTDMDMADAALDGRPVIFHTERLTMADPGSVAALRRALKEKEIVICSEVGSGVIPLDPRERRGREATGRLCILLAQDAEAVVRMVCGIPCVIKGTLPSRFSL